MNVTFPQTWQSFHTCITTNRPSLQRYYIQPFPSALLATKRHPICFHELLLATQGGKNDACSKSCRSSMHELLHKRLILASLVNQRDFLWYLTPPITCQSTNVIYKLSCRKCNWIYIGETRRRFADRLQEHRGYITQKKINHPTGAHFNSRGHQLSDILGIAIERVLPKDDHMLRKCRESYWINQYDSTSFGGNIRDWNPQYSPFANCNTFLKIHLLLIAILFFKKAHTI